MRLDAQLRDFILATWESFDERTAVSGVLQRLDAKLRPAMVMAREVGAPNAVHIAESVLVVTRERIGMGWPMHEHNVLWRRP